MKLKKILKDTLSWFLHDGDPVGPAEITASIVAVIFIASSVWQWLFAGPGDILDLHRRTYPTDPIRQQQWLPPGKPSFLTDVGLVGKSSLSAPGAPTVQVESRENFAAAAEKHGEYSAGFAKAKGYITAFYLTHRGEVWVLYTENVTVPDMPGNLYGAIDETVRHEGGFVLSARQEKNTGMLKTWSLVVSAFALAACAFASFAASVAVGVCGAFIRKRLPPSDDQSPLPA